MHCSVVVRLTGSVLISLEPAQDLLHNIQLHHLQTTCLNIAMFAFAKLSVMQYSLRLVCNQAGLKQDQPHVL